MPVPCLCINWAHMYTRTTLTRAHTLTHSHSHSHAHARAHTHTRTCVRAPSRLLNARSVRLTLLFFFFFSQRRAALDPSELFMGTNSDENEIYSVEDRCTVLTREEYIAKGDDARGDPTVFFCTRLCVALHMLANSGALVNVRFHSPGMVIGNDGSCSGAAPVRTLCGVCASIAVHLVWSEFATCCSVSNTSTQQYYSLFLFAKYTQPQIRPHRQRLGASRLRSLCSILF